MLQLQPKFSEIQQKNVTFVPGFLCTNAVPTPAVGKEAHFLPIRRHSTTAAKEGAVSKGSLRCTKAIGRCFCKYAMVTGSGF